MRPLRFLLSLTTIVVAFLFLVFLRPWSTPSQDNLQEQGSVGAYFNWRSPSSLFPPSAIISLTDDNSTFFLARPAAFGPLLPAKSLSGRLWIGSGFGDDHLGHGSVVTLEGELGCSDVPGWDGGSYRAGLGDTKNTKESKGSKAEALGGRGKRSKRHDEIDANTGDEEPSHDPSEDDGTDDHLHHPLPASDGLSTNGDVVGSTKKPTHADIQSLQESAEIAGQVVLLSRGGCGFLEKVKWVQRRGGIALIVGDDIRGGPLVTMYARGDTSNVTIPSLFTSHTTAHLLSSLIPSGGLLDGLVPEDPENLDMTNGDNSHNDQPSKQNAALRSSPTAASIAAKATSAKVASNTKVGTGDGLDTESGHSDEVGWFRAIFSGSGDDKGDKDGAEDGDGAGWVLQKDFDKEEERARSGRRASTSTARHPASTKGPKASNGDDFVIGVQDWRDPDLVAQQKEQLDASSTVSSSTSSNAARGSATPLPNGLKGGSITPGSGEYAKAVHYVTELEDVSKPADGPSRHSGTENQHAASSSWLTRLLRANPGAPDAESSVPQQKGISSKAASTSVSDVATSQANVHDVDARHPQQPSPPGGNQQHEGLWVTLTPTSMSSSPFFDTLLVLVVSPLVTLTVVYALLLLRSRIRRRRWRAPKSVVARLPVRTYQTMPPSSASPSGASPTTASIASPISATTPLLPSATRPINTGRLSRPRSRTESEVPAQHSSSLASDEMASPSPEQIEEKRAAGLARWRARYGGRQRECVVCLDEYVDGVSRVMSLPCGHEFHAECITPWLTTRRRTCPICKGDVVRSLGSSSGAGSKRPSSLNDPQTNTSNPGSPSRSPPPPYIDIGDEDEVQEMAAATRNEDPAAQQPMSREDEAFEDLERGVEPESRR